MHKDCWENEKRVQRKGERIPREVRGLINFKAPYSICFVCNNVKKPNPEFISVLPTIKQIEEQITYCHRCGKPLDQLHTCIKTSSSIDSSTKTRMALP